MGVNAVGYCYGRSSWLRTARDACQCQPRTPVLLFRLPEDAGNRYRLPPAQGGGIWNFPGWKFPGSG